MADVLGDHLGGDVVDSPAAGCRRPGHLGGEGSEGLRDELVLAAQADARISAAALVGSLALGREDRWSDIDLALCVDDNAERPAVIAEWTDWI